jgi:hypothetical protein
VSWGWAEVRPWSPSRVPHKGSSGRGLDSGFGGLQEVLRACTVQQAVARISSKCIHTAMLLMLISPTHAVLHTTASLSAAAMKTVALNSSAHFWKQYCCTIHELYKIRCHTCLQRPGDTWGTLGGEQPCGPVRRRSAISHHGGSAGPCL